MAVGLRFDHGHERAAGGQGLLQHPGIVDQGISIHLPPGTGSGGGTQGAQPVQHQCGAESDEHHSAEVPQAVADQQLIQMEQMGGPPHHYDGPGVEQVDQQGEPLGPQVPALIGGSQKIKEEEYAQGQSQVHTIVALET